MLPANGSDDELARACQKANEEVRHPQRKIAPDAPAGPARAALDVLVFERVFGTSSRFGGNGAAIVARKCGEMVCCDGRRFAS